ncbi:hypothetical protein [Paenibacillus sp. An7]|uniref:hypothetical protein n=1 Tax=Paenibacillus sp. An7 TaxID=2689577 RepID=UPI00135A6E4E|nr:hypothetical protein [Paenibacillus sp. An7]
MTVRELKFYFKKHKFLSLTLYLQLTLFFVILGTFIAFEGQLDYESNNLHKIYEGKAIYQLLDGYYDGDEYANFVSQSDYLNRLKTYYNQLNNTNDFQYLAMFNHHILLKDTGIPEEFIEGYEQGSKKYQENIDGTPYTAVKSFQMNKQAMDYFGLSVEKGTIWDENEFKDNTILPVLLGSAYQDVYSVGDETTINFYSKTFTVKIIGFLKENSKLFFNDNTEFYLDKYIILPYRDYEDPTSETDELFQQISYFAMVNGYIVTDNSPSQNQIMMQRVEAISKNSSFGGYSFIGLNPHFQKYRGLMTVLQENKILIQSIFVSTFLLNLIVIIIILLLQQKRRLSSFAIHYLNGATKWRIVKMLWIEISTILLAAYLTNFIILDKILNIGEMKTQFILLILCITMSIIICIMPARKLLLNPMTDYINNEDEGGI